MTPSASSFVQSISSEDSVAADEFVENKVLFEYVATSEFELGVHGPWLHCTLGTVTEDVGITIQKAQLFVY